jgi:hypothetical protein
MCRGQLGRDLTLHRDLESVERLMWLGNLWADAEKVSRPLQQAYPRFTALKGAITIRSD